MHSQTSVSIVRRQHVWCIVILAASVLQSVCVLILLTRCSDGEEWDALTYLAAGATYVPSTFMIGLGLAHIILRSEGLGVAHVFCPSMIVCCVQRYSCGWRSLRMVEIEEMKVVSHRNKLKTIGIQHSFAIDCQLLFMQMAP